MKRESKPTVVINKYRRGIEAFVWMNRTMVLDKRYGLE
jgi:hypothetical protein